LAPVDKSAPEVNPDAEHELVIERVAAVDVAKAAGKVCVRLPAKTGRRLSARAHTSAGDKPPSASRIRAEVNSSAPATVYTDAPDSRFHHSGFA
jgi:hypothetical protein